MARTIVYLRVNRKRNGFKDPPIVDWDNEKETKLREMLRDTNQTINWEEIAQHFQVSQTYVLQQAAWLYEKELSIVKKRMSQLNLTEKIEPLDDLVKMERSETNSANLSNLSEDMEFTNRRLLTMSRIDLSDSSLSDSSLDTFLPPPKPASNSLDSSIADSALEDEILEYESDE